MGANLSVEQIAEVLKLLQSAGGMAKKVNEAAGTSSLFGGIGGFFSCQDNTDIVACCGRGSYYPDAGMDWPYRN